MRLAAAFALIAISATVAHADTLAPSSVQYSLRVLNQPLNTADQTYDTTFSSTTFTDYRSSTSPAGSTGVLITGGTDPLVGSFVGSANPGAFSSSGLSANIYGYYEFEVLGPSNQSVNVDVAGSLSTSYEFNNNAAYADLTIVQPSNPSDPDDGYALAVLLYQKECAGTSLDVGYCGVSSALSNTGTITDTIDQTISVFTNTAYVVELHSDTSIFGTGGTGASSTADPTITLDSSNPAYSLQFSPGLLAPVPEPSSFALVATAFGSCLAGLRRRKATM